MRILFANEKCGQWGGAEENLAQAARGLAGRGHDCFLAYAQRSDRQSAEYAALFQDSAPCQEMDGRGGRGSSLFSQLMKQWKPDVIYLHKAARLPFKTKPPVRVVRMVHDHDLCCPRRHKYFSINGKICHRPAGAICWADLAFVGREQGRLKYQPVLRKILEMKRNTKLDRLLVASRFMRHELLDNGFAASKVRILPPVPEGKPTPAPTLGGAHLVLYVGQLIKGKGVDLLLKAMSLIKTHFVCAIAGEGNAMAGLKSLAQELGLADSVHFLGWQSREELSALYAKARLLAVPSRWPEPFGMIGLEAMAMARPVAAFAVGGIPDWLVHGENGLLADEADVPGMAENIRILLEHPGKARARARRAGRCARNAIASRLTWKTWKPFWLAANRSING